MINYKKTVLLIISLLIIVLNSNGFGKKKSVITTFKIENKFVKKCDVTIVDTIIKKELFKVCYDSLKNKVGVNYKGSYIDFTPMEFFNVKSTMDKEYALLTKNGSKYFKCKIIILDDEKILFSLIDEFLASGLYIISKINGELVIENINLNEKNISATELVYFDLGSKNIILADKLSQDGKKSLINVYNLSANKPKLIKQKIIEWSKFKKQIKKSKDGSYDAMNYYRIIDKAIQ